MENGDQRGERERADCILTIVTPPTTEFRKVGCVDERAREREKEKRKNASERKREPLLRRQRERKRGLLLLFLTQVFSMIPTLNIMAGIRKEMVLCFLA